MKMIEKTCEVCSVKYLSEPSHYNRRKYCSRKCFETSHKKTMLGENNPSYKHGGACRENVSPEYESWQHMLNRCGNPKDKRWARYGKRGITVCERWKEFKNFYEDMGDRPTDKHTLERLNNDGNYEPSNCIWATPHQQTRNRRSNINITHDGKTMCLKDWAEQLGIKPATLYARIHSGWTVERAFTKGVKV